MTDDIPNARERLALQSMSGAWIHRAAISSGAVTFATIGVNSWIERNPDGSDSWRLTEAGQEARVRFQGPNELRKKVHVIVQMAHRAVSERLAHDGKRVAVRTTLPKPVGHYEFEDTDSVFRIAIVFDRIDAMDQLH